jgi:NADH-ubiquinone oxidoreductase chain 2
MFIILITIGISLYNFKSNNKEHTELIDEKNSPIQLVNQFRGYFYINRMLSLSLAITIFSFIGIPPLIGFFGKQMVLSAGLDKGYIFLVLVAILTSVISAVYYLNIIKETFFYPPVYQILVLTKKITNLNKIHMNLKITITSPFASIISIITLIILLFIFINKE